MQLTEEQKREIKKCKEAAIEHTLAANFFINVAITDEGAGLIISGNRKELVHALLHAELQGKTAVLEEITQVRNILGGAINDFLELKDEVAFKILKEIVKQKIASNEASND